MIYYHMTEYNFTLNSKLPNHLVIYMKYVFLYVLKMSIYSFIESKSASHMQA